MSITRSELLAAVALDLTLGDPRWLPHPIRAVGWMVKQAEEFWRATPLSSRAAGAAMWVCVAGSATVTVRSTLPRLNVYWAWVLLALRGLDQEAIKAARQWRFQAGTKQGQPVPVLVTIAIAFTLR